MLEKNKLNNFIVNHLSLLNKQQKFYRNKIQINETKYLLVDGYNYLSKFFYIGEEVNHSKLFIIKKKINKFIDLCREKDFKLIVFIDAYIKTQETYNKWIIFSTLS